jgi:hypothetical protein
MASENRPEEQIINEIEQYRKYFKKPTDMCTEHTLSETECMSIMSWLFKTFDIFSINYLKNIGKFDTVVVKISC